jgi:hypothetical protein
MGEPDSDIPPKTPGRVAKSKGKRPQRSSTPIEISDSEGDSPTPQAKPRREDGSASRSRALKNVYVHPYSSVSLILSSVCPLAHPRILLLGNFVLVHPLGLYLLFFFLFLCLVVYASFSVALSQEDPSEDLSEPITPLNLNKKGALASREANNDVAIDKAPAPPPSAGPGSPGVYLEDM